MIVKAYTNYEQNSKTPLYILTLKQKSRLMRRLLLHLNCLEILHFHLEQERQGEGKNHK